MECAVCRYVGAHLPCTICGQSVHLVTCSTGGICHTCRHPSSEPEKSTAAANSIPTPPPPSVQKRGHSQEKDTPQKSPEGPKPLPTSPGDRQKQLLSPGGKDTPTFIIPHSAMSPYYASPPRADRIPTPPTATVTSACSATEKPLVGNESDILKKKPADIAEWNSSGVESVDDLKKQIIDLRARLKAEEDAHQRKLQQIQTETAQKVQQTHALWTVKLNNRLKLAEMQHKEEISSIESKLQQALSEKDLVIAQLTKRVERLRSGTGSSRSSSGSLSS